MTENLNSILTTVPATLSWTDIGQYGITKGSVGFGNIPAVFPTLQSNPLNLSFNFPGVLGTRDFPADNIGGIYYPQLEPDLYQSWPWNIIKKVDTQQSGSDISSYTIDYAQNAIKTKGLFSNLVPGAINGTIAEVGRIYDNQYNISSNDTNLPPEYRDRVKPAFEAYNKLLFNPFPVPTNGYQMDFRNNNENNTFLMGPYSKVNILLGDGNNIVMNSPAMFAGIVTVLQQSGTKQTYPFKTSNYIFYPSAQGEKGTNTLKLGDGNNIIYYDSSMKEIVTGDGNNVFLPSFGSFNWAQNNLQSLAVYNSIYNPKPTNNTFFTPVPQTAALEQLNNNKEYSTDNIYAIVSNWANGYLTERDGGFSQMTYVGGTAGAPNNPYRTESGLKNYIDPSKAPTIGGQSMIGGKGNDVFYGVDPRFYDYDSASDTGIKGEAERAVFRLPTGDTKNERFSYQNFETIKMLGGGGNNIFYLGNPTKISPDGMQFFGDFTYQIATSHKALATEAQQKELAYGAVDFGANTVSINLSTNLNSYTNTTQNFDQKTGTNPKGVDIAKASISTANATNKFFDKVLEKGKVWKFIPYADFALSAASAITDIVKLFSPPDPQPTIIKDTTLLQPLGSWKKAVEINDWNPGTIIEINVDPTITTAPSITRWNNIQFTINNPTKSTGSVYGTSITWQQGNTPEQPLLRLDGLGSPQYGYYSYNFGNGKYEAINQNNLSFFGTIAIGVDGINPLKNYTANNGFVFSSSNPNVASLSSDGVYDFYWNDLNNSTINLDTARLSARSLSIEFDSRSLGWYWQPVFASKLPPGTKEATQDELNNAITLDENASRLWVENDDAPGTWKYYTFKQFDTVTEAFRDALLAKTYYQVNGGKSIISADQKATNDLVQSFEVLDRYMPDLTKLDQSASVTTKIGNLGQVTRVVEWQGANGQKGAEVYFVPDLSAGTVFKTIITVKNGTPVASAPVAQTVASVAYEEATANVDINFDKVSGYAAVDTVYKGAIAKSVSPSSSIEAQVTELYDTILARDPDAEGLKAWVSALSNGLDKKEMLAGFLASEEFLSVQSSNGDFAEKLYAHLLHRNGTKNEITLWEDALDDGRWTHEAVIDAILKSPEFVKIIGSAPA